MRLHRRRVWLLAWLLAPASANAHMQWTPDVVAVFSAALLFPVALASVISGAASTASKLLWAGLCLVLYPAQTFLSSLAGYVLTLGSSNHDLNAWVGAVLVVAMWFSVALHLLLTRRGTSARAASFTRYSTLILCCGWMVAVAGVLFRVGAEPGFQLLLTFALVALGVATCAIFRQGAVGSRSPMPNPPTERTSPGKPGAASQVKR